jgi:catechol 2,3-dioxygenase-like lactoylglutathione lyase family enzyme
MQEKERSMSDQEVTKFGVSGINHLALVCKDMKVTVDFYENVLGFPLIKTLLNPWPAIVLFAGGKCNKTKYE